MSWLAMKICLLAIGLQGACKLLAMRWYLLPDTLEVIPGELCLRLTALRRPSPSCFPQARAMECFQHHGQDLFSNSVRIRISRHLLCGIALSSWQEPPFEFDPKANFAIPPMQNHNSEPARTFFRVPFGFDPKTKFATPPMRNRTFELPRTVRTL